MTSQSIESRLHLIGHGACIAVWNGSFDVQLLDSPRNGPVRRVLASGAHLDEALFARADERVAELKAAKVWPCEPGKPTTTPRFWYVDGCGGGWFVVCARTKREARRCGVEEYGRGHTKEVHEASDDEVNEYCRWKSTTRAALIEEGR